MLSLILYAYVRKTRYYARTMAVRWKRYLVYLSLHVFTMVYVALLVSTIGSLKAAQTMLSLSVARFVDHDEHFTTATTISSVWPFAAMLPEVHHPEGHPSSVATTTTNHSNGNDCLGRFHFHQPLERLPVLSTNTTTRLRTPHTTTNVVALPTLAGEASSQHPPQHLAICQLDETENENTLSHHHDEWMPHTLQHLGACVSHWLGVPSSTIPVLVVSNTTQRTNPALFQSLVEVLASKLGVRVLEDASELDEHGRWMEPPLPTKTEVVTDAEKKDPQSDVVVVHEFIHKPQRAHDGVAYARQLNQLVRRHRSVPKTTTDRADQPLRIGILQSSSSEGWSIANPLDLVEHLSTEPLDSTITSNNNISSSNNHQNSTHGQHPVVVSVWQEPFFEDDGETLGESLRGFHGIDVWIAPHGDPLLAWIPVVAWNECSHLIEVVSPRQQEQQQQLQPPYGSLFGASRMGHSIVRLSDRHKNAAEGTTNPRKQQQQQQHTERLCLDPIAMVDAVRIVVADREKCLLQRKHPKQARAAKSRPEERR